MPQLACENNICHSYKKVKFPSLHETPYFTAFSKITSSDGYFVTEKDTKCKCLDACRMI